MTTDTTNDDAKAAPMLNEDDIGSGERSPGQIETDKMIGEVPPLPEADEADDKKNGDQAGTAG